MNDLPIALRFVSTALDRSHNCPSASETILEDMIKQAWTVCIFHGMYCINTAMQWHIYVPYIVKYAIIGSDDNGLLPVQNNARTGTNADQLDPNFNRDSTFLTFENVVCKMAVIFPLGLCVLTDVWYQVENWHIMFKCMKKVIGVRWVNSFQDIMSQNMLTLSDRDFFNNKSSSLGLEIVSDWAMFRQKCQENAMPWISNMCYQTSLYNDMICMCLYGTEVDKCRHEIKIISPGRLLSRQDDFLSRQDEILSRKTIYHLDMENICTSFYYDN